MQGEVILFYNPHSGRFSPDQPLKWKEAFAGCGIHIRLVSDPLLLREISNSHIIAAGGDGTLHVAINHADTDTNSFTILPVGSGNDFASHFPKMDIPGLAANISAKKVITADLLEVNGIRVHNVSGAGFEAMVAHKAQRVKWTAFKYILPVARHLFSYKPLLMRIEAGDYRYQGPVFMVSMGNGKRAGGGFRLFPDARLDDGKLDLLVIRPPGFWQKILYVWLVNFGRHKNLSVVDYRQVSSAQIQISGDSIMEADGDVYPAQEISARVIPAGLKLIVSG